MLSLLGLITVDRMVLHFIYFKLFIVCVLVCICACVSMCVLHVCMCVCALYMSQLMCGSQRTTCRGQLSPRVSWDSNQTLGFMVELSEPFCQAGIAF